MLAAPKKTVKITAENVTKIVAALFILLFVYTAISKIGEHQQFVAVLKSSPLIGSFANFVSWGVPVSEIIIAAFLFFPATRKTGLKLSLLLMSVFTIYIAYMILFVPHLPCSCGGVINHLSWSGHLVFNLTLIALSIIGLYPHKLFIAVNPVLAESSGGQAGVAENL